MNFKLLFLYIVLYAGLFLTGGSPIIASLISLAIIAMPTLECWGKGARQSESFDLLEFMKLTSAFADRGISADSVLTKLLMKVSPKTEVAKKLIGASANGKPLESVFSQSFRKSSDDQLLFQNFSNALANGKYSTRDVSPLLLILNENRSLKLQSEQELKEAYFRILILSAINSASMSFLSSFAPILSVKNLTLGEMNINPMELTASLLLFSLSLTIVASNNFRDFWLRRTLIYSLLTYVASYFLFKVIFIVFTGGRL